MEGITLPAMPLLPGSASAPSADTLAVASRSASVLRPSLRHLLAEGFSSVRAGQAAARRTALLSVARSLPLGDPGHARLLLDVLQQQLAVEPQRDIQSSIVAVLASLAIDPHVAPESVVLTLLRHAVPGKSGQVRAQVLVSLQKIAQSKRLGASLIERALESGLQQLEDDNPRVRKEALLLLAHLTPPDPANASHAQAILSRFTSDTDFRVRMAGFEGALVLHGRGVALDIETFYWRAVHALDDDYEEVRTQALHLIWVLSNMYSEHMVSARGKAYASEMVRLVDDGFMKICNMVMDPSVAVRRLACRLLGSIRNVRTGYLLQTLSKEVISKKGRDEVWTNRSARNQASARNRSMPTVEKGLSYLPGTAIGEMELDMEDFVLSDSGAAGAFIHGLEDEFFEVRMAAVDSICELSLRSRHLASRALEYLVDMFNDEIEDVRVNSIESVHKIIAKVDLKEEQIKMMQPILEEANESIRMAMYHLLAATKCPNAECLHSTIKALLQNMNRYPEDRLNIYQCLKGLGKHHGQFVELLVEPLLATLHVDLRFLGAELHMEDSTYVALAIVILNAGADNSNILHLLPSFIARHHRYFRDKYPALFPSALPFPSSSSSSSSSSSTSSSSSSSLGEGSASGGLVLPPEGRGSEEDTALFFSQVLANVGRVVHLLQASRHEEALRLILVSSRDLSRIAEVDGQRAATAEFYRTYLQCLDLIVQSRSGTGGNDAEQLVGHLLFLSYRLEREFVGLHAPALLQIFRLRLYARLLVLSSSSTSSSSSSSSSSSTLASRAPPALGEGEEGGKEAKSGAEAGSGGEGSALASVRRGVERVRRFCEERGLALPADLAALLPALDRTDGADIAALAHTLLPREAVEAGGLLKRVSAEWQKPLPNEDKPVTFPSSLYHPIRVEALVHHVSAHDPLFVHVTLPDRTVQAWPLRASDLKPLGGHKYRLATTINLYVNQLKWTEACNVQLDLVLGFELDVPSTDLRHTAPHLPGLADPDAQHQLEWRGAPTPSDKQRCLRSGFVRLCPTHRYSLLPIAPPKK